MFFRYKVVPDFLGGLGYRYAMPPYLTLYPGLIGSVCLELLEPFNV